MVTKYKYICEYCGKLNKIIYNKSSFMCIHCFSPNDSLKKYKGDELKES
jgi:DNA-directed RNA polymerase subunit RPC12/RpoP